jgi:type IV pilus assembly protein PilX
MAAMTERKMNSRRISSVGHQRGFALIASLLILVILTLLGVSMFSGVGLQEKMAGNLRTKMRALDAANAALAAGEQNLLRPLAPLNLVSPPTASDSATTASGNANVVWSKDLAGQISADPTGSFVSDALWGIGAAGAWSSGTGSGTKPLALNLVTGSLVTSNGDHATAVNNAQGLGYLTAPELYIEVVGSKAVVTSCGSLCPQGQRSQQSRIYYYRLTARGAGGNAAAVAVTQEFFGRIW